MILGRPFQLCMFYDSVILLPKQLCPVFSKEKVATAQSLSFHQDLPHGLLFFLCCPMSPWLQRWQGQKLRLAGVRHVIWGARGHRQEQPVVAAKQCPSGLAGGKTREWSCFGLAEATVAGFRITILAGGFLEWILNSYELLLARVQLFLN